MRAPPSSLSRSARRRRSSTEQPDLSTALQASGGIVVFTDARRRITWCNPAFTALSGYTLAQARGRSPGELLQFEGTSGETVTAMREALRAGQGYRGRVLNRAKSGREYWLDLDIQPLHDKRHRLTGYVSVQSDVTQLVQTIEHLRGVIDSAVAGIVVQDGDGRILSCNPEAEQMFERREDQLVGRLAHDPSWRLVREDGLPLPPDEAPSARALSQADAVRNEAIGLTLSGGRRRWLEVSSRRIAGRREGDSAVVSSFVDTTAQRLAMAELDHERARLRAALEGTQAGMWEWNLQTGEARADARWAEIGGRTLADLEPLDFKRWTALIHPEDEPAMTVALRRHIAGESGFFSAACRLRHQQGHWVWVAVRGRIASFDDQGRPLWMYGTNMDITAAHEDHIALKRANSELQGLFDLSPLGMALSDLNDGRFLEFNDALVSLLGHGREQLGTLTHRDLLPQEARPLARAHRQCLLEVGRFGPDETELLHRDGHLVPVLLSGIRVQLLDGSQRIWTIMEDLTPRKSMERRLREEARTDRLTALPNRTRLLEQLEACTLRSQADPARRFALLFLDFDRFKAVNDTLGHDVGDRLLQLMADRLRAALRLSDVIGASRGPQSGSNLVARLGGDEFVVLLAEPAAAAHAESVARRLIEGLAQPYQVDGHEIHSSVSIGIVLSDGGHSSATDLLRYADMAMYAAKRAGRSTCAMFDRSMLTRAARAGCIEEALRHAIDLDQLSLVYQPIVCLESGEMTSVEALLRWTHPELGAVSPAEFIPIAEESGLIVPIGAWVLRQACGQWRRWLDEAGQAAPQTMSVNLSRVQLAQGAQLQALVSQVLLEVGMAAGNLQLEVTEREVMNEPEAARGLMNGLRAMGVRLAMDDFGTGASSLGCLRDYPFDVIKIDKSFIDGLGDNQALLAVVQATVSVIQNLGMTSVAEGIEKPAQVELLRSMGCGYGQGYHFARPLPPEQVLALLQTCSAPA